VVEKTNPPIRIGCDGVVFDTLTKTKTKRVPRVENQRALAVVRRDFRRTFVAFAQQTSFA